MNVPRFTQSQIVTGAVALGLMVSFAGFVYSDTDHASEIVPVVNSVQVKSEPIVEPQTLAPIPAPSQEMIDLQPSTPAVAPPIKFDVSDDDLDDELDD
ncbi:MAG: hypothetical protein WCK01_02510 [Candidatus Uhrbacteria bacterium]